MVDLWIIFFFFFVALIYCGTKLTIRVKRKVQINVTMLYTQSNTLSSSNSLRKKSTSTESPLTSRFKSVGNDGTFYETH